MRAHAAAINIGIIGLIKMLGGERPRHFRRVASTA